MKRQGSTGAILRFLRAVILIDASLGAIVGLISFVLGLRTLEAYGTLLIWAAIGLILIACFIGVGSVASRTEDTTAFWLSRAGNMSDNLKRISEASQSSLGCFFLLLVAGLGLLISGYIIPVVPVLFR
jgi:hypothetical protein